MPFELIYARKRKVDRELEAALEYFGYLLRSSLLRGESLRQALLKMGWR